ncbi:hypothetical protein LX15_005762, partial [Streptoalloteichus tenebrarius]|nr:hypothetical protein [Streptoalloteichus tenebrarius]
MRKVCSMSKRRGNACQARSTSVRVRPVRQCQSHTGFADRAGGQAVDL